MHIKMAKIILKYFVNSDELFVYDDTNYTICYVF